MAMLPLRQNNSEESFQIGLRETCVIIARIIFDLHNSFRTEGTVTTRGLLRRAVQRVHFLKTLDIAEI